jgi:hypothetical protein
MRVVPFDLIEDWDARRIGLGKDSPDAVEKYLLVGVAQMRERAMQGPFALFGDVMELFGGQFFRGGDNLFAGILDSVNQLGVLFVHRWCWGLRRKPSFAPQQGA